MIKPIQKFGDPFSFGDNYAPLEATYELTATYGNYLLRLAIIHAFHLKIRFLIGAVCSGYLQSAILRCVMFRTLASAFMNGTL